MAAWQLAARGADVLAFDSFAPGHDRGAAGGESRIFRTALKEGSRYVALARRARQLWRQLETDSERSLLSRCGCVTIGPAGHPDIRQTLTVAAENGLAHEVLSGQAAHTRLRNHPLAPGEVAVVDPEGGLLRPEPAVLAAAQLAERHGARLHPYTPVIAVEPRATGASVHTTNGTYEADHVVLTPGPWAPRLPILEPLQLCTRKITTAWFPALRPRDWAPEVNPVVIRRGNTAAYSCFPCVDGVSVKISMHSLPWPVIPDPDALPRTAHQEFLDAARAAVAALLPSLHAEPVRTGVYSDAFTADTHPIIGALPGADAVTVLTGFSGHGFKLAPALGELAADLVLEGRDTRYPAISELAPRRFRPAVPDPHDPGSPPAAVRTT